MKQGRGITIVVHADGDLGSRQYRLPLWAFAAAKWGALGIALLVVLFFAFAGPITRSALRAPFLDREVARLKQENGRVQQLAAALNRAEHNYQSLRQLLGVRATPRAGSGAGLATPDLTAGLMRAVVVRAGRPAGAGGGVRYETGASAPGHWPLDMHGFVTRGQVRPGAPEEAHPGIDIAAPEGTPVRAAGGGKVQAAGMDRDYGLFVLLRHPDGYETMYGHASRLLVNEGDDVGAGQVIALTGSSGRSTAPHLHFEIRRGGRSVDPLTLVKEGN
jgi:murein DD-endopeptidase MepM/ murein hydrolase activator NlpD